jgi:hypothetical protein
MSTPDGVLPRPRRRPGPKPRGRTVVPLTITVTHAQRDALVTRADAEKSSISTVVRRFIAAGLAASGLVVMTSLIAIAVVHCTPGVRSVLRLSGSRCMPVARSPT